MCRTQIMRLYSICGNVFSSPNLLFKDKIQKLGLLNNYIDDQLNYITALNTKFHCNKINTITCDKYKELTKFHTVINNKCSTKYVGPLLPTLYTHQ